LLKIAGKLGAQVGARGIEKNIVCSPVASRVEAQSKLVMRIEGDIKLAVGGVADLRGGIYARQRCQVSGCLEN
jgi:hypothetical protein